MENNKSTPDFEKFIRRELQQVKAGPDENTWSRIAAQQSRKNTWLRFRYLGKYGLLVLGIAGIVVLAWRWLDPVTGVPQYIQPPAKNIPDAGPEIVDERPALLPDAGTSNAHSTLAAQHRGSGKSNEAVAPPVRPLWYNNNSVPQQQIRFRADSGLHYTSSVSGNSVRIPANALVYADGTPVRGAVDLSFREYRSIADFLAAGMPMHYSDGRGDFFFNSGGMFEVRVRQNNAEVFLAPGKTYEMSFASTGPLQDANLFLLSDTTDKWSHTHGRQVLEDTVGMGELMLPKILSESDVAGDNAKANAMDCLPGMLNIPISDDPLVWIRDAVLMGRDYARGKTQPPVWFRNNADKDDDFFLKCLERSDIRVVHQSDVQERFFPDDLNGVFTELAAFKDCYFTRKVDSIGMLWRPDPQNSVVGIFGQNRTWRRVRVIQETGSNCILVLSDEKDEINVPARLAKSSELYNGAEFNPDSIFTEYERLRDSRHADMAAIIQGWRHFRDVADMFQTSAEWCMTAGEWFNFFEQNRPFMQARYDSLYHAGLTNDNTLAMNALNGWRSTVRKLHFDRLAKVADKHSGSKNMFISLTLTGFGTYNWDQIFQLGRNREYVASKYKTADGRSISPVATRIIERSTRLFFSMPNSNRILKMPGRFVDVVVTGSDGRTYFLPAKTYAGLKFDKADHYTFTLEDVTDKVGSSLEWAELLGI